DEYLFYRCLCADGSSLTPWESLPARQAVEGHDREPVAKRETQALVQVQRASVIQGHRQADPLEAGVPVAPQAFQQERPAGTAAVLGQHRQVADETFARGAHTGHQVTAR